MLDHTSLLTGGLGVCTPSHKLVIKPTASTVELGAFSDLLREVFGAVHRANRHTSEKAGYAALCLPAARDGGGLEALGDTFVIMGTEEILQSVLMDYGLAKLGVRGMFKGHIREHEVEGVRDGYILARSRLAEKHATGTGFAARKARRSLRRNGSIPEQVQPCEKAEPLTGFVMLKAGRRIDFIARKAPYLGEDILVTSYGLSRMSQPCVLPWSGND